MVFSRTRTLPASFLRSCCNECPSPFVAVPRRRRGLWYLPGTAHFHVLWTGVAEVLGGAGLVLGAAGAEMSGSAQFGRLKSLAAWGLFFLTVAVTPANIYMYVVVPRSHAAPGHRRLILPTRSLRPPFPPPGPRFTHGAMMEGLPGPPAEAPIPLAAHYARAALQSLLLAQLLGIARGETALPGSDEARPR